MRRIAPLLLVVLLAAACGSTAPPEVPAAADGSVDQTLVLGREVWGDQCSRCHGGDGGGRSGPRVNGGRVIERYPDVADQVAIIVQGRGGMPSFEDRLSAEQIDAVVAYTREVLVDAG